MSLRNILILTAATSLLAACSSTPKIAGSSPAPTDSRNPAAYPDNMMPWSYKVARALADRLHIRQNEQRTVRGRQFVGGNPCTVEMKYNEEGLFLFISEDMNSPGAKTDAQFVLSYSEGQLPHGGARDLTANPLEVETSVDGPNGLIHYRLRVMNSSSGVISIEGQTGQALPISCNI